MYDIIFLDHMMPEMDGIETLKAMKELEQQLNTDTPIIALTANAIVGAKEQYLDAGFSNYLSKPIQEDELMKILGIYLHSEAKQEKEYIEQSVDTMEPKTLEERFPSLNIQMGMGYCMIDEDIQYNMKEKPNDD